MTFILKRTVQDVMENKLYNMIIIITIALSTLISSSIVLVFSNVNSSLNSWKKGIKIIAYLKHDVPKQKILSYKNEICDIKGIDNVVYVAKHDALLRLEQQIKKASHLIGILNTNPLPDAFEISILPDFYPLDKMKILAEKIKALSIVSEVECGGRWIERFQSFFEFLSSTGIVFCIIFFTISIIIIINVFCLIYNSRQKEIEIMRLIGASDQFIKIPFYIQSVFQGLSGGIIGVILLWATYLFIALLASDGYKDIFSEIHFISFQVVSEIVFFSMMIGFLGCYLSIKHYLKM